MELKSEKGVACKFVRVVWSHEGNAFYRQKPDEI